MTYFWNCAPLRLMHRRWMRDASKGAGRKGRATMVAHVGCACRACLSLRGGVAMCLSRVPCRQLYAEFLCAPWPVSASCKFGFNLLMTVFTTCK